MFLAFFIVPGGSATFFAGLAIYSCMTGFRGDSSPWLILYFGFFACWFVGWIFKRVFGIRYVVVYDRGLFVRDFFDDHWIPWEDISNVEHSHHVFILYFLCIIWNRLLLHFQDKTIVLNSGTGFTFSKWKRLFEEIETRASGA